MAQVEILPTLEWRYQKNQSADLSKDFDFNAWADCLETEIDITTYRRFCILYDYEQIFVESEDDNSGYWVCYYDGEDEEAFKIGQSKVDELILNKPSPGQLELNYEYVPQL